MLSLTKAYDWMTACGRVLPKEAIERRPAPRYIADLGSDRVELAMESQAT